jgi:choline dehydrogenase-like flavoprotein
MSDLTPWDTKVGPATLGGAYPRSMWDRTDPHPEGSAVSMVGPDPRLEVVQYPDVAGNHVEHCDVVIIGSGAGGAVVAKELAEAGRRVIVIEEGPYFTKDDFTGPPFKRFQKVARDAGTTQTFSRSPIPIPLGKAVGGSTVINSGTCWRAPDKVLRSWGMDPSEMVPYFERVERIVNVRPAPRELWGSNAEITHRGASALGLSGGALLRNIGECHGCGTCAMGCSTNAKQAMHVSYLPLAQRAGAKIYARTRAEHIVVRRGRAEGVEAFFLDDRENVRGRLTLHAPVVVVAAGTIHTPVVLKRSALTGRSRQLGRNLRIHPAVGVAGAYPEQIDAWRGTLQPYFVDELFDSHDIMLETTSPVPALAAAALPGIGAAALNMLGGMRHVASIGLYVSDTSSGRVRLLPRSREPIITYKINDTDLRKLLIGMRLAAEIHLAAGAMAALVGLPGLPAITSTKELDKITDGDWDATMLHPTAFHPMGTCRMGSKGSSVVDTHGEHHDVRNLYVADGSIFPTCVAVNPQISIMAFATRTAEQIARKEQG